MTKPSWWSEASIGRTLLLTVVCAIIPFVLGRHYVQPYADLPYAQLVQPWLPWAVAGLAAGLPLLVSLGTLAAYGSGKAGLDPGAGVSVAIGAGFAPLVAMTILLQRTGWLPMHGLPMPDVQMMAGLALTLPVLQLAVFGLAALAAHRKARRRQT